MNIPRVINKEIVKIQSNALTDSKVVNDLVAVEQPLEIKIVCKEGWGIKEDSLAVTMRTPAHDFELVLGFLFTEGIIRHFSQVKYIRYCTESSKEAQGNIVKVELQPDVAVDWGRLQRNFYTTSSCGVCGKTAIDAVHQTIAYPLPISIPLWDISIIHQMNQIAKSEQTIFVHTGGVHASALFDEEGNLILLREDVGRHNALDKLIGAMLYSSQIPLHSHLLWLSGRISFELVQKALMAGIPIIVAVGAPSSLALELAQSTSMTLIGFARNGSMNIYAGKERLK